MAPGVRQSGDKTVRGRITRQGNRLVCWIMVEAAQTARLFNERFGEFYERYAGRKGHGKAVVAVAHEVLRIVYFMLKRLSLIVVKIVAFRYCQVIFLRDFEKPLFGGDSIRWLLKALQNSGLFRRNRFSLQVKVKAILLYMAGLSYRDITYVLRVVPCSREAVRLWVKKLEQITVNVEVEPRRMVAVDETRIKADDEWCYFWAAIDVDTRELLAVRFPGRGT